MSLSIRAPKGPSAISIPLLAVLALSCGEKGPPLPPEPRGPLPPGQVGARQVGGQARVGFVVPVARGEKEAQQPVRAEVIRVSYPPGVEATADPDAFRRRGEIVTTYERDPLESGEPLTLSDATLRELSGGGTGYTIRYGVRVRDRRGRPSPLVVAADLGLVAPAPPPAALRGEPTADGIRLVWNAPAAEGEFRYNVYRPAEKPSALDEPLNAKPLDATEFLDTTGETGERYRYMVRVALAEGRPHRESEDSETIAVVAEDRFAPTAPHGLVAVQEGTAVRLFWDPNPERDLRGYRVFRRRIAQERETAWERIGPDPVERPLYLDAEVELGQRLAYRVVAVDRTTPPNESRPSEVVEIELLGEPTTGEADRP
jgi:hypothetical protein